jgi:LacI family transcriptional regulator
VSPAATRPATLKTVAERVGLSPTTVSLVLNEAPGADAIPRETKDRVIAAARALDYRPNYLARSLRSQRSFSVGVLVPEISEGYAAGVIGGIEEHLLQEGYFYLVGSHRFKTDLLVEYLKLLRDRLVEGYVLVNTPLEQPPGLPAVAVSGHRVIEGVTNVAIDHDCAARLALSHLRELGHERIAFFKGHPGSLDTEDRWRAIVRAAKRLAIPVRPELTLQLASKLEAMAYSPEDGYQEGYVYGQRLLATGEPFTTLFAFNDVSAIGAMRAFLDAGLRIPEDVSVVGFDDIQSAAFQNPSLTTVRQPLREMGAIAARTLLGRLAGERSTTPVMVEPELVVRGSTGPCRARVRAPQRARRAAPAQASSRAGTRAR